MKITVDLTEEEESFIVCDNCKQCSAHDNCENMTEKILEKLNQATNQAKTAIPDGEDETRC